MSEQLVTRDTGAVRFDGGKPAMHLVPPEIYRAALPVGYHPFVDWWAGDDSALLPAVVLALQMAGGGEEANGVIALAEIYTYGANKYAPRNWELGLQFSCCYGSGMRHALKGRYEFLDDPAVGGSGRPHAGHYAWNVVAAWIYRERGMLHLDDRSALNRLPIILPPAPVESPQLDLPLPRPATVEQMKDFAERLEPRNINVPVGTGWCDGAA